jgi:hypothetical protein
MPSGFIQTLGDLRDNGIGLYAHCISPNVGHGSRLDLDALIDRLGEQHVYINDRKLASALVSRRCGQKGALITTNTGRGRCRGRDLARFGIFKPWQTKNKS